MLMLLIVEVLQSAQRQVSIRVQCSTDRDFRQPVEPSDTEDGCEIHHTLHFQRRLFARRVPCLCHAH